MSEFIAAKIAGLAASALGGKLGSGAIKSFPISDVIQWDNDSDKSKEIVWKHPVTYIKWGTALIVKEYEFAAFFRDGKMYDVFGPGRHVLTNANLPLLGKFFKAIYSKPLFTAEVIFISTKEFDGLFGGRSQSKELFPLLANGQYWYKVNEPTLFVNEVVGGNKKFTTEEVMEFFKGFVNQAVIKELASYSLTTVFTEGLDEVALKTKAAIFDKLRRFGIDLFDLKFRSLDTEERYRELAAMVKQGVSASEVLRMFTLRESAKELGKSTGGASLGAGFVLPQMVSQMPPPQASVETQEDPIKVLKILFAKGEISKKEYDERKKVLEES
jgi:membrane protease subunit (stomatin/prohibitin family)